MNWFEYALISAYLYVCFGAMMLYKMAILNAEGISYAPYGLAVVKALILGKFMLLGHAARLGDRYQRPSSDPYYCAQVAAVSAPRCSFSRRSKKSISGIVHGRTLDAVLADMTGSTLWQTAATSLIILLILLPYIAFREIAAALGEDGLRQLLLARRAGGAAAGRAQLPVG